MGALALSDAAALTLRISAPRITACRDIGLNEVIR